MREATWIDCRLVPGVLILLALAGPGMGGCASVRVTDPPRTATEQFLLSAAAARAVSQLNFDAIRGRRVYLDADYFAASEEEFVLGELRARLLVSGVQIVQYRPDAEVIMEVRSGGVGIDREDYLLGVPALVLSADSQQTNALGIPFTTPELALLKNIKQDGIASVAFVAYWADTGEVVATSGPFIGRSVRDDWWFFGIGPRTVGDIPPVESDQ